MLSLSSLVWFLPFKSPNSYQQGIQASFQDAQCWSCWNPINSYPKFMGLKKMCTSFTLVQAEAGCCGAYKATRKKNWKMIACPRMEPPAPWGQAAFATPPMTSNMPASWIGEYLCPWIVNPCRSQGELLCWPFKCGTSLNLIVTVRHAWEWQIDLAQARQVRLEGRLYQNCLP